MDHNSIIDRDTFEVCIHAEDHPKVFICDKMIAPAISELNKRGYKTLASCSGHYSYSYYEWFDVDLSELEEVKNNSKNIIKRVGNETFDYISEVESTHIYVLFDKNYLFKAIPDGFELEYINDKSSLEHEVSFYKNNTRKRNKEVFNEIEKYCNILREWASNLPERKDD